MSEQQDIQFEALFGKLYAFSDHKRGEMVRFRAQGSELQGEILWVRAPGPAIEGGKNHPLTYVVDVGDGFPHMVRSTDVIESQEGG